MAEFPRDNLELSPLPLESPRTIIGSLVQANHHHTPRRVSRHDKGINRPPRKNLVDILVGQLLQEQDKLPWSFFYKPPLAIIIWPISRILLHWKIEHAQMVIQPHLLKKKKNDEYSVVVAKTKFKRYKESKINYLKQQRVPLEVVTSAILKVIQSIQGLSQNHRSRVACAQHFDNVNNLGVHGLEVSYQEEARQHNYHESIVVVLIISLVLEVLH